ncbi:MAG: molybdopterin-binding protein [Arcobacteraceae bacterium]|jgi:molybdopterin-biosynthesis enzyme MoeA-like protein|nr:molybdopterin-binding protein [Arcobacteraceae bacterium]
MKKPNFYTVIIGTELLNGRRKDAHFDFVNSELLRRGFEHKASFVIKDEPKFIEDIFKLVKADDQSVMFCFGGIGATPDDYTRIAAGNVFRNGNMEIHTGAKELIYERFGDDMYPHRINMANLPLNAGLLKNVVSNVPGFYLDERFFFCPGFPSMARDMVLEALDKFYPQGQEKFSLVLTAYTSENTLIDVMEQVETSVDLSSLPQMIGDIRKTIISISGYEKESVQRNFALFTDFLEKEKIDFNLGDNVCL